MEEIDYKNRSKELANDNIKVITDNVCLKLENENLLEALVSCRDRLQRLMAHNGWCMAEFGSVWAEFEQADKAIKKSQI